MAGASATAVVVWLLMVGLANLSSCDCEGRIVEYKWEVKFEHMAPDYSNKLLLAIKNGGTGTGTGTIIQPQQGYAIIVELNNSLLIGNLAIHWHAIRQIQTPWLDGTEVAPGDTFFAPYLIRIFYWMILLFVE